MISWTIPRGLSGRRRLRQRAAILSVAVSLAVGGAVAVQTPASAAGPRIDLRALVVDDGSVWVKGITDQFTTEGVPFTDISLSNPARPTITAAYLANGSEGYYDAVVLPDDLGGGLPAAELSALSAYEAQFGVRQVDSYQWANPTIGLNYAASPDGFAGDLTGLAATVTPAAQSAGFGYLSGAFTMGVGTYGFVSTTAGTGVMPSGGTFTPFVTLPIPGSTTPGSLVGVYTNAGVQKLVITGAMSTSLSQFRLLAHGIVTWVTGGIHFGYNRNYFTMHFDDAFNYDSTWDPTNNCTPGEDCPTGVGTPNDIRMTPADVDYVANWEQANNYTVTLAFNGYYSLYDTNGNPWNGTDALTNEFVAKKNSFNWLNHGYQHIFQGCNQDFTVVPWKCVTTDGQPVAADGSNISWVSASDIQSEIADNIKQGQALGLPFNPAEYLSGEHSGMYVLPQQPVDNPNFGTALTAEGIKYIGADASREPGARVIGSATTVPRHPTALYYNAPTDALEVSEYNHIYLPTSLGGSGYCSANAATATCLTAPLASATGYTSYIVPTDTVNDMGFILSNDPRPFYAHVTNLTAPDYDGLQLLTSILSTYRGEFAANTPPVNLTLTQASNALTQQQNWATAGMGATPSVTGYVQDGVVTVNNTGTAAAPLTVPTGTTVNGATFGSSYGGEQSGWINGSTTLALPGTIPVVTSAATTTFTVGTAGTYSVVTAPAAATVAESGALPAGVTFTDNANGTATLAGTPATGATGTFPLTITATGPAGSTTQAFSLVVNGAPAFTSAASATAVTGSAFSFPVATTGNPAATLASTGTLPSGITFTPGAGGTAVLAGTATAPGTYPLTFTATNNVGSVTQAFTLTVSTKPVITSTATGAARVGAAFSKLITSTGSPVPAVTVTGLPAGLTFAANTTGGGSITGTPAAGTGGVYTVTVKATNAGGSVSQSLALTVSQAPAFTSATSVKATSGTAFTATVTTSGYPAATLTSAGSLPGGVKFVSNGNGTATLSGTPTTKGTYLLVLTAKSTAGTALQVLTLTVA